MNTNTLKVKEQNNKVKIDFMPTCAFRITNVNFQQKQLPGEKREATFFIKLFTKYKYPLTLRSILVSEKNGGIHNDLQECGITTEENQSYYEYSIIGNNIFYPMNVVLHNHYLPLHKVITKIEVYGKPNIGIKSGWSLEIIPNFETISQINSRFIYLYNGEYILNDSPIIQSINISANHAFELIYPEDKDDPVEISLFKSGVKTIQVDLEPNESIYIPQNYFNFCLYAKSEMPFTSIIANLNTRPPTWSEYLKSWFKK